jgi:hypothetical protein
MAKRLGSQIEFGDFQTPPHLAEKVCGVIHRAGFLPASVVEPTCGIGAFIVASLKEFPTATHFIGVDRDAEYVQSAKAATTHARDERVLQIFQSNFFDMDWPNLIAQLPKPTLILGNPPWVTNATIGALGGTNLPYKTNRDNLRGIDAITGKSNFDISEWMIRQNLEWFDNSLGMLAVLCKTAVARKVLADAWSRHLSIRSAEIRRIDAKHFFGATVDACLLVIWLQPGCSSQDCRYFDSLDALAPRTVFGMREGMVVSDVDLYEQNRNHLGYGLSGWRSGIKHDRSSIFELTRSEEGFKNKLGEVVCVEEEVLFPLLKSSDLARNRQPSRWLLVPQRTVAESPELLKYQAPKAWKYLNDHSEILARRGSSVYRGRPPFSIFGVGAYSFSPWKVGISGLYKTLNFVLIPPVGDRPVVLDDTCYFFPCETEQECRTLYKLVQSPQAHKLLTSLIFWDAKRPITARILNLLDIKALAQANDAVTDAVKVLADRQCVDYSEGMQQLLLFRERANHYP